ncbi:hypothetical protein B0O79_2287 [Flavobacteriaceae bacterium MAR_2009_75]|nr:hypothetical protein B0O79_2287 [Flavobacteriaceae bacterium MAR_2009_75]
MKNSQIYSNVLMSHPFAMAQFQTDFEGRSIIDMVLTNAFVSDMNISEMKLAVTKFSAFDEQGNEHNLAFFLEDTTIDIQGLHKGLFLRSRSVSTLNPGRYKSLRFYIKETKSTFKYHDRKEETAQGFEYLDFQIKNGLLINGDQSPEAILRFDFVPVKSKGFSNTVGKFFRRPRYMAGKLVHSFGH